MKTASARPQSTISAASAHTRPCPANSSTAIAAWVAQRRPSEPSITRRAPSRSAAAPPSTSSSTIGRIRAAITTPSPEPPPPPSSTAKATATEAIEDPNRETA